MLCPWLACVTLITDGQGAIARMGPFDAHALILGCVPKVACIPLTFRMRSKTSGSAARTLGMARHPPMFGAVTWFSLSENR